VLGLMVLLAAVTCVWTTSSHCSSLVAAGCTCYVCGPAAAARSRGGMSVGPSDRVTPYHRVLRPSDGAQHSWEWQRLV